MRAKEREPGCVDACPACPHRDFSLEESENQKNRWLSSELEPWGNVLRPIISPAQRWGYRRKALLHARRQEGVWRFGLIRMHGREEEFIPIPQCPLHAPGINQTVASLSGLLPQEWPVAFALLSGEALTIVLKSTARPEWVELMKGWRDKFPGKSFFVNWNPVAGKRAVDSRRNELVFGEEWIRADDFFHGPSAFRQQIPEVEDQALTLAEKFLGHPLVVDLYSGLGVSLARWRKNGWEAIGAELSGESVRASEKNNPGVKILRGRVEERLPQVEEFLRKRPFVVYTNPPRPGHSVETLDWLLTSAPERIAYLSCHPRSLAGDLAHLSSLYDVELLQPLDFFPQTGHVETLALLRKRP